GVVTCVSMGSAGVAPSPSASVLMVPPGATAGADVDSLRNCTDTASVSGPLMLTLLMGNGASPDPARGVTFSVAIPGNVVTPTRPEASVSAPLKNHWKWKAPASLSGALPETCAPDTATPSTSSTCPDSRNRGGSTMSGTVTSAGADTVPSRRRA